MSAPLFLCDRLVGDVVVLDGAEGRHAATVRRLRTGERVDVTDGRGHLVHGQVAEVGRDRVSVTVLGREDVPAPAPRLVVVQALAKGGRDEDAVEAMTEVGVDVVVPWGAARSVARWKDRSLGRWRAVAREAAKQSRRAWVPEVTEAADTAAVAARLRAGVLGVVLHEGADRPLAALAVPPDGDVVVVVGPEGGLTDEEVDRFAAAGGQVCRLGPTVLRTSTAGVAAATVLLSRSPRWS